MKIITTCLCCFFLMNIAVAQNLGSRLAVEFRKKNGVAYKDALVGGLNNPQFSEVDLNNDQVQDLLVFDKTGNVMLTFLNQGTANQVSYKFAPQYAQFFPKLAKWTLMRDYNGDGVEDIFTYANSEVSDGIEVYRGFFDAQNSIKFQKVKNFRYHKNVLTFEGLSSNQFNIYVSNQDIPDINDIDNDGDLDVLTFNIVGGVVEYFQNQSVEQGFGRDSLRFKLKDRCWGRFYESGFTRAVDFSTHPDTCAVIGGYEGGRNPLHVGSTVLSLDMNGDGDKELILGDIAFPNLNLLTNSGNANKAYMTAQDINFPNTYPVNVSLFPAAFHLDVNNDGKKDLLASPNETLISENRRVAWYYKNIGTNAAPNFQYQRDTFLVDEMLDFGSEAYPAVADYNADGLPDLFIGTQGAYDLDLGGFASRLVLLKNVGSRNAPVFKVENEDYLQLSQYANSIRTFAPAFGDLDGDGDQDLVLGTEDGRLLFAQNTAGSNQPFQFANIVTAYKGIDVGQQSRPTIFDIDKDGLADLVIGERNGNLNFYKNIGTIGNAHFNTAPNNSLWAKIDTREIGFVTGFSSPTMLVTPYDTLLFVGTELGKVRRYGDFKDTSAVLMNGDFANVAEGFRSNVAFADLDDNHYFDMIVGNSRGGIAIYQTNISSKLGTPVQEVPSAASWKLKLFPNPVGKQLNVQIVDKLDNINAKIFIYDVLGKCHIQKTMTTQQSEIEVHALPSGVYFCRVLIDGQENCQRFLVK